MPSSAAALSPPPIPPPAVGVEGGLDVTELEYEYEYEEIEEEIEVEEEVEVDQEVEEEVEKQNGEGGDVSEIGEDLTPVREENNLNDTNQDMEPEVHGMHLNLGSLTVETPVIHPPLDIVTLQETVGGLLAPGTRSSVKKEKLYVNEEKIPQDSMVKTLSDGKLGVNDVQNRPNIVECNSTLGTSGFSYQKDNGGESYVAETIQTTVEAVQNVNQITSRIKFPLERPRDLSYHSEFDGENKRPKLVCEFHAKGWCIKGKACRFLHINKESDIAEHKADVLDVKVTTSSEHILPPQSRDISSNSQIENVIFHKHDPVDGTIKQTGYGPVDGTIIQAGYGPVDGTIKQTGKTYIGRSSGSDGFCSYSSSIAKSNSIDASRKHYGNFTGCSFVSHENQHLARISSFDTAETISKKNEAIQNSQRLNLYNYSMPPIPFCSSSWKSDVYGTWNVLNSNRECHASISSSLLRSASPLSGSNSGNLSGGNVRNTQASKYENITSHDDWKPSIPFRPSHAITQNLFRKESLYDPILDSVDQTGGKDRLLESYNSGQGIYVENAHLKSSDLREGNLLNSAHIDDSRKSSTSGFNTDTKLKFDKTRQQLDLQTDGSVQKVENDRCLQNESKIQKYFHAALVEFVKELVKPTWQEGLMSKNAHKMIVKKASDKVFSSLQPHQIPNTAESIKSYLSVSESKLSKLVEGYIEKYGKT